MSKSKKNVVDPTEIIETYGVDTARWFMLSDSPPERDLEWTEAGVEGAWRFPQRLWRLVEGGLEALSAAPAAWNGVNGDDAAMRLRRATHKTIAGVTDDIEASTSTGGGAALRARQCDRRAGARRRSGGAARDAGDLRPPDRRR